MQNTAGVGFAIRVCVFTYLAANLWYRFWTIFDYSRFMAGLFIFFGACSLGVIFFPKFLKAFLFFFGASFFLFGFRAYDIQSQVFETVVPFVALTVFLVNFRREGRDQWSVVSGQRTEGGELRAEDGWRLNEPLVGLILCYIGLSAFSLMLLPLGHIVKDFWFFGLNSSAQQFANATPNSPLYALGGLNRLILFSILSFQLAIAANAYENFKFLFSGIFSGAVFCAIVGLLDFSGVISLKWYRLGTTAIPGVLHSTFLNRGWFSEFILSAVPFVLIGIISQIKYRWWKIMLFVFLVVCGVVLILSGARAGWVSYPLVLFICWLFFYFVKDGGFKRTKFGWWNLVKAAVSVPVTIAISFLLVFQVLLPLSDVLKENPNIKNSGKDSAVTTQYLKKKASTMITASASSRPMRWKQGFNIGRENPIFGMGYESFRWHAGILPGVEGSYSNRNVTTSFADTPHCTFYQLFVSGGIVGLCLWMIIILYAMTILIIDLVKNQRLLNIPVVISIISFHMYGAFQSMQYIPMIWSLIFLNLGYGMTIDDRVLSDRVRRVAGWVVKVMVFLVLIGGVVYFMGRGSQDLADRYGLRVYAQDQDWHDYSGFYQREKWAGGGYRWSGKRGSVKVSGQKAGISGQGSGDSGRRTEDTGVVEFDFVCSTPGVGVEPVRLMVSLDGTQIDEIVFWANGGVKRWYYVKGSTKDQGHEFVFDVSRTWNPKKMGNSGGVRDLGIAVSEPRFLEKMPEDGIGFYGWETTKENIAGWPEGMEKRFRWTGKRASQAIADCGLRIAEWGRGGGRKTEGGGVVFLRCGHPGIGKDPVVVRVLGDGEVLRYVEFQDYGWKRVDFGAEELEGKEIITYEVSRTWNPKRMGVSEDGRDLGVAVAIP